MVNHGSFRSNTNNSVDCLLSLLLARVSCPMQQDTLARCSKTLLPDAARHPCPMQQDTLARCSKTPLPDAARHPCPMQQLKDEGAEKPNLLQQSLNNGKHFIEITGSW